MRPRKVVCLMAAHESEQLRRAMQQDLWGFRVTADLSERPDVVLLDGSASPELVREIADRWRELPICVVLPGTTLQGVEELQSAGAARVLGSSPLPQVVLREQLRVLVARKRGPQRTQGVSASFQVARASGRNAASRTALSEAA